MFTSFCLLRNRFSHLSRTVEDPCSNPGPLKKIKTKLRGHSLQANYTDRATAACSARLVPNQPLRVTDLARSAKRIQTVVNLGFLDQSRYFLIQVAPQLSWSWVDPVLRKYGRVGNRTRDLWICSQKLWPLDHRGGLTLAHKSGVCLRFQCISLVHTVKISQIRTRLLSSAFFPFIVH
jgi:hypothetical protein